MYFVDRQNIEKSLVFMENKLNILETMKDCDGSINELALERLIHVLTDCMLDVSNAIIDGFIMRDPGSYEDIVDILLDERVINKEMEVQLKAILPLRKQIVQEYKEVDHLLLEEEIHKNVQAFVQFPSAVRRYLQDELGPVSAFKK